MKDTIKIKGMTCNHCVMAVAKALNGIAGVKEVQVDLGSGSATFEKDANVDMEGLKREIEKAGYQVG